MIKKNNLIEIAKSAENWMNSNKNASEQELKNYMKDMWTLLGNQTDFKFSVWTVPSYGIGYGFSEHLKWGSKSGPAKDLSQYSISYLNAKKSDPKKTEIIKSDSYSSGYQGYVGKTFTPTNTTSTSTKKNLHHLIILTFQKKIKKH